MDHGLSFEPHKVDSYIGHIHALEHLLTERSEFSTVRSTIDGQPADQHYLQLSQEIDAVRDKLTNWPAKVAMLMLRAVQIMEDVTVLLRRLR